jgi:manganese efflux pump family protein
MTAAVLVFGFLAGLDNVRVCSSIGLLPLKSERMRALAAAFLICELAAPGAGLLAGSRLLAVLSPWTRAVTPLIMAVCGLTVILMASRKEQQCEHRRLDSPMLFVIPVSLSLDNFIAGAGISPLAQPAWVAALCIGAISAAMSCAGLYGAARLRRAFRLLQTSRVEMALGAYLCMLSMFLFARGSS